MKSLKDLRKRLQTLQTTLAQDVAADVAPRLTTLAGNAYDRGRTVYGDPRPKGTEGQPLDLVESNATRRTVRFTAIGTTVRCVLGTRYARFLIGKYKILPNGGLPVDWSKEISDVAARRIQGGLRQ